MALSSKIRTGQRQAMGQTQGLNQNLTMTPQLAQSIKLLQMSSVELLKHIEEEMEKNPLLELAETDLPTREDGIYSSGQTSLDENSAEVNLELDTSQSALEEKLDTSFENEFDGDRSGGEVLTNSEMSGSVNNATDFSRKNIDGPEFENFVAQQKNLRDHLLEQLALTRTDPVTRIAASEIIDNLDEDGYFRIKLHEIAVERGIPADRMESALSLVQGFDPLGIGARSLGECLIIQLKDKNRFDPAMASLIENLDLLAKRDFDQLMEICRVSLEDLLDMVDEIKALDPRPARSFDTAPVQGIIPDIFVTEKPDGSFAVELNSEALPNVLVNQTYKALVSTANQNAEDKAFITDCLQGANWLVRSLEQRANTILKVMAEIVRMQDGFFVHGVSHLKPMSLKQVADAIKMHESTVSRVTSNKYVLTQRGVFELKFFFTASIGGVDGTESHSAEAVRQRIRKLVDEENINSVLSDDSLVDILKTEGIDIARRTVAKYRESLHIASSVQRRREKRALAARK